MQSKRGSLTESVISTAIGMGVSLSAQLLVFPLYGMHIDFHQNLQILAIFTVISIARQYFVRRLFNRIAVYENRNKATSTNTSSDGKR